LAKITDIKWRKRDNGLYFNKFETKEEAWEWLQEQAKRFRYSKRNNVRSIVEEAEKEGIIVYATEMGRWFKNVFNLTLDYRREKADKKTVNLYLETEVVDLLHELVNMPTGGNNKSWLVNQVLRIFMGMGASSVVCFIDDKPVFFYESNDEVLALSMCKLDEKQSVLIESFVMDAEDGGLEAMMEKMNRLGYYATGL
jgi:hypothetical protein